MAIVPLSKITCYGPLDRKTHVLEELQRLGCVHVLNLRAPLDHQHGGAGGSLEAHDALRYLQSCPVQRRPVREGEFDFDRLTAEILAIQDREEVLSDEIDELRQELSRQKPWGEFEAPPPQQLNGLRLWFFIVPHYRLREFREIDVPWQVISRDHQFEYVVLISAEEPRGIPAPRVELDRRPLTELKRLLDQAEDELEDLYWRRVSLTRYLSHLEEALAVAADRQLLEEVSGQTWDADRIFALQCWSPTSSIPDLTNFAKRLGLALTVEPPRVDDTPPTLLDNPELLAGGEEAVKFYMTPGYHTWDPSKVVFFSFSLFFAMILSDAGYGLLLAITVWLLWKRLADTPEKRRVRRLGIAMAVSSMLYGVLVGTYFGYPPPAGSLLSKAHWLNSSDQQVMMPLSILLGAGHIGLGIAVNGWRWRDSWQVLSSIGWGTMLLGGLSAGAALTETGPPAFVARAWPLGVWMLAAGAGLVLCFGSDRPFPPRSAKECFWRLFDGLRSLTGISSAFGDVLSYLRLFALGLASAQLALTFNALAKRAADDPALGVLLAGLVFLIGHAFNFVLSVLSGVVHGLRLNCIEFFKWSLPEEGRPFRAFCKKAKT